MKVLLIIIRDYHWQVQHCYTVNIEDCQWPYHNTATMLVYQCISLCGWYCFPILQLTIHTTMSTHPTLINIEHSTKKPLKIFDFKQNKWNITPYSKMLLDIDHSLRSFSWTAKKSFEVFMTYLCTTNFHCHLKGLWKFVELVLKLFRIAISSTIATWLHEHSKSLDTN